MKTFSLRTQDAQHDWYLIDATGKTLGRLATELALRLRGKHKPNYTPHVDNGDYMVVLNADKIAVTGKKRKDKIYYWSTGTAGGLKQRTFTEMQEKTPEKIIHLAVKGMLPRGPLGRAMAKKLRVFVGDKHTYQAQSPKPLEL